MYQENGWRIKIVPIRSGRVATIGARSNHLVDCFNHKLPSLDGIDDAIWICSPDEGLWVLVGLDDEAFDCLLKIDDRVEDASLQASPGELGEETLDGVQP